jgi:heme/copper-type cytochrome/quinol oxidase subunit 3
MTNAQPIGRGRTGPHTVLETPEEIAHELRAAEGALWTGSRLVIGIAAFSFASLGFAYFYLRSTNNEDLWRPQSVTASVALGTTILVIALASTAMSLYGTWRRRAGSALDSEVAGWLTVLGGCLAVGIQVWELFELHFYPGSSGYASCFVAWGILNSALLLSGTYWTETILARSLRLRLAAQEEGVLAAGAIAPEGHTASYPLSPRITDIEVGASNHYWVFIGLVSVIFWLMFYVI